MKVCSQCRESKPLDAEHFYKHIRSRDGFCAYCIACDKKAKAEYYQRTKAKTMARVKVWQEENAETVRGYKRNWKRRNPHKMTEYKHVRRAREYSGGKFTGEEWLDLCAKYGNICLCCKESKPLTVDHVIPLALGGLNDITNIQPLCIDCNMKKGIKIEDYR